MAYIAFVKHVWGLVIFLPSILYADCFKKHLDEAIQVNRLRKPFYIQMSQGRSEDISNKLIKTEKLTRLIFSGWYEYKAQKYEKKGVPILCEGFVSMEGIKPLQDSLYSSQNINDLAYVNHKQIKKLLAEPIEEMQFHKVALLINRELSKLKNPRFNCMMRHVLESIGRFSALANHHDNMARSKGLQSSLKLSQGLIKLHMKALTIATELDQKAAPLQAEGLGIICDDVPSIP